MNPIGNGSLQLVQLIHSGATASGASLLDAGGGSPTLPEPTVDLFSQATSGDLGAELAALSVKAGEGQREMSQRARDAFEGAMAQQEDTQVAAMRQKAEDIEWGGLVSGLFTIGDGLAQGGEGLSSFNATTAENGSPWKLAAGLGKGVATCSQAGGTIASAISRADEERDEILAMQSRSAADHAKTAADKMNDAAKDADSFVRAAIDFYREYSSAQNQSVLASLHRT